MTTELEQQFFKTFGIKPIHYITPLGKNYFWQNGEPMEMIVTPKYIEYVKNEMDEEDKNKIKTIYPEITAEKLLELICIANKVNIEVIGETVEETKNKLLEEMVYWKDDIIYKEIQQLFKEKE